MHTHALLFLAQFLDNWRNIDTKTILTFVHPPQLLMFFS